MDDSAPIPRVRNWKLDLGRVSLSGIGSVLALTIGGWPANAAEAAWLGLAGLLVGLALAFATEYIVRLHSQVSRLKYIERDMHAQREQQTQGRQLFEQQLAVKQREADIRAVFVEVWGGAYAEAIKTGQVLPVAALLARYETVMKARGFDTPPSFDVPHQS